MTPPENPLPLDPNPDRELDLDGELDALLREQPLLPLPPALRARILADVPAYRVLRLQPVRPWALACRAAAAILVFFSSWLAFSGTTPALASVMSPEAHLAAAIEGPVLTAPLDMPLPTAASDVLASAAGVPAGSPLPWLAGGLVVLFAGLALGWKAHRRASEGGAA